MTRSNLFALSLSPLLLLLSLPPASTAAFPIPPTCGDLASPSIFTFSFAGAHFYLLFSPSAPGLGSLSYRQFSDWTYKEPLFGDVATLSVPGPARLAGAGYLWRPDAVLQNFTVLNAAGSALAEGSLNVAFLDAYNVEGRLSIAPTGVGAAGLSSLVLSGSLSNNAHAQLAPFSAGPLVGATAHINASLRNEWNYPPSPLPLTATVAADCPGAAVAFPTPTRYQLTVPLPASQPLSCTLRLTLNAFAANTTANDTTVAINSWLQELAPPPPAARSDALVSMYYNSWFNFWYNTEHAEGYWLGNVITPSKSTYGRGMWLWDSAFHVMALVHGGPVALALAADQVRVLVAGAKISGHLPREVWAHAVSTDIQAPGALTWAALLIYNRTGNLTFLEEVYDTLAANNAWYYKTRDPDGNGLCEWEGQDSGWDSSPRWDQGIVEAVDLNCWLALDQQLLAQMAGLLGRAGDASTWRATANITASTIRRLLWSEPAGVFFDRLPASKGAGFVSVITPATFWTLLAGVATPEQAARMVTLLSNSSQLGTPFPMPCVGRAEPTFNPTDYWRGPTWINLNYLTFHGLFQYGMPGLARALRQQTLDIVARGDATPREYYNPLTGGGLGAYNYMWTGALLIATVNELDSMP